MTDTMPRCETCKWWGNPDPDDDGAWSSRGGPGHEREGWKSCGLVHREWYGDAVPEGVLAMVDGYEWDGLYTAPDFGCVQHETAEAEPQ